MKNKIKNCWEFKNCPTDIRYRCNTYIKNLGDICWFITKDNGEINLCDIDTKNCIDCKWYTTQNI